MNYTNDIKGASVDITRIPDYANFPSTHWPPTTLPTTP